MKVGFDKNVLQMETPMENIGVQQKLQVRFSQIVIEIKALDGVGWVSLIEIRDLARVGATAPTYFQEDRFCTDRFC